MLFHGGKTLRGIAVACLLLAAACQEGNSASVEPDTTHFMATANGLAAITLHNGDSGTMTFNIPATGTSQYAVVTNPGSTLFYTNLLSGISYCPLTAMENGCYTTSVAAGQSCDILLVAAHNNPPSQSRFTLNIGQQGSSASYPITVSLSNYLYVAGEFTSDNFRKTTYNHLAKWDGSAWSPVTSQGVDNDVNVIVVDPLTGDLYAGGWFKHAGTLTVNDIVKFNRNGANALGAGLDNAVNAITFNVTNNNVVVGGNFTHYLAVFNGSCWSNLDSTATLTGPVRTLAYDDAGTLWVGGNFPKTDTSFANGVGYPLYQDAGSGLSTALYTNDRVDALLAEGTDVFVGGDFNQYATALNGTATPMAHIGKLQDGVLTQVGQNGDINRVVKSLVQVGNILYLSGYFETAYPGQTPDPNPYGTVKIAAACSLTNNTCTNMNTPINSWAGTYWVYQLVADNQGQLYGVVRQDNTLDGGLGPDLVYTYTQAEGWQALSDIGFNYLAFSEALGSVINVSGR